MPSVALFFNAQKESKLAQSFGDRCGYWPLVRADRSVQRGKLQQSGAIYECICKATGALARCRPAGDSYSVASGELQPCSKAFAQDFSRFVQSAYDHDCLTFILFLQEPLDALLAVFAHPRDRVQLDAGFNRSLERHPVHMIKQVLCEAHR